VHHVAARISTEVVWKLHPAESRRFHSRKRKRRAVFYDSARPVGVHGLTIRGNRDAPRPSEERRPTPVAVIMVARRALGGQLSALVGGHRRGLGHYIIVQVEHGAIGLRLFFCTDPKMSVTAILQGYAHRCSIEVCLRALKQPLGFADSSARTQNAGERTAPFVGYCYTLVVLWFVQFAYPSNAVVIPVRLCGTSTSGACPSPTSCALPSASWPHSTFLIHAGISTT
jgi:hypothetical protein